MDALLDQVRDGVEAPIVCYLRRGITQLTASQDFEGQRLVTLINYALLSTFGVCTTLHCR
jgi:hypothetical protein